MLLPINGGLKARASFAVFVSLEKSKKEKIKLKLRIYCGLSKKQ